MRGNRKISEIKRAENTDGVLCQTHIGGQALIEGVMMRGKYSWAAAVRTPDGTIHTEEHDLATRPDKHKWLYWPIIRGCRALVESLVLGYKALEVAANNAYDFDEDEVPDSVTPSEEGKVSGASDANPKPKDNFTVASAMPAASAMADGDSAPAKVDADDDSDDGDSKWIMIVGMVLGLVLGVAAFIMLPAWLANLVVGDYNSNFIVWNIFDGVARVGIFILYIWAISKMKDIKRMFRYHGAEHKTIHCFEHGLPLTPENARQFSTLHVRCGTAFLIMTLILAIIVFSCVPVKEISIALGATGVGQFFVIVLSRIIFIPLVAGLGYELTVKWAGSHPEQKLVRIVLWPGLQMQRLTTAEPDDSMLECAIAAMQLVIAREEREEGASARGPVAPQYGVTCPDCVTAASSSATISAATGTPASNI